MRLFRRSGFSDKALHLRRPGDHWRVREPADILGAGHYRPVYEFKKDRKNRFRFFPSDGDVVNEHVILRTLNLLSPKFLRRINTGQVHISGEDGYHRGIATVSDKSEPDDTPDDLAHRTIQMLSHGMFDRFGSLVYTPEREGEIMESYWRIRRNHAYVPGMDEDALREKFATGFDDFMVQANSHFVLRGDEMRDWVGRISDPHVRQAYEHIYDYLKDLHGREYTGKEIEERAGIILNKKPLQELRATYLGEALTGKRIPLPRKYLLGELLNSPRSEVEGMDFEYIRRKLLNEPTRIALLLGPNGRKYLKRGGVGKGVESRALASKIGK
jgi:hypothetical protein